MQNMDYLRLTAGRCSQGSTTKEKSRNHSGRKNFYTAKTCSSKH